MSGYGRLRCKLAPLMTIPIHWVSMIRFAAADGEDHSSGHYLH